MKYIFLDSNIYLTCAMMRRNGHNPALLSRMLRHIKKSDAVLVVPEVVEAEVTRLLKDNPHGDKATRLFSAEGTRAVVLSPEALTRAMLWTVRGDKPARTNTDVWGERVDILEALDAMRFRYGVEQDCLILASLSEFMSDKSDDTLAICTSDRAWYSDGELTASIKSEFACEVVAYDDLTVLLKDVFGVVVRDEILDEYIAAMRGYEEMKKTIATAFASLPTSDINRIIMAQSMKLAGATEPDMRAVQAVLGAQKARLMAIGTLSPATDPIRRQLAGVQFNEVARQVADAKRAASRLYGANSPTLATIKTIVDQNARLVRLSGLGFPASEKKAKPE